jgi:hypothetical protein
MGELIAERCYGLNFSSVGPGLLGRADNAKFNAEMVVPVVALNGGTTKSADCGKENIIIEYLNGGCRFCWGYAADNRDLRGGTIDQRFNSSLGFGTLLLFLRCFVNFLLTDLIEK